MTYVELIVVLSIFAIMSSIVMFNYRDFEARVEIRKLASDIALQIVQAQKNAMSGKQASSAFTSKPSYGIHFDLTSQTNKEQFIYFADLDNDNSYDNSGEMIGTPILITKGNLINNITVYDIFSSGNSSYTNLDLTFTRPNSGMALSSSGTKIDNVDYINIDIKAPDPSTIHSYIKAYSSGRIEIN